VSMDRDRVRDWKRFLSADERAKERKKSRCGPPAGDNVATQRDELTKCLDFAVDSQALPGLPGSNSGMIRMAR
jgi:hypothetical protein